MKQTAASKICLIIKKVFYRTLDHHSLAVPGKFHRNKLRKKRIKGKKAYSKTRSDYENFFLIELFY